MQIGRLGAGSGASFRYDFATSARWSRRRARWASEDRERRLAGLALRPGRTRAGDVTVPSQGAVRGGRARGVGRRLARAAWRARRARARTLTREARGPAVRVDGAGQLKGDGAGVDARHRGTDGEIRELGKTRASAVIGAGLATTLAVKGDAREERIVAVRSRCARIARCFRGRVGISATGGACLLRARCVASERRRARIAGVQQRLRLTSRDQDTDRRQLRSPQSQAVTRHAASVARRSAGQATRR